MTDTKNRQPVREAIAELFRLGLVGDDKPVAEVAAYQKKKIDKSPIVMVMGGGSSRTKKGLGTKLYKNLFSFEVHVLIRDSDESGLSDEERENRLDLIDKMIS